MEAIKLDMAIGCSYAVADAAIGTQTGAVRFAITYMIYHCIERPIRRAARKIAFSGQWSY